MIAMTWYKHRGQTEHIIRVDPRDGGQPNEAGLPIIFVCHGATSVAAWLWLGTK